MGDTAQGRDNASGRWVVGGSTARNVAEAQEAMGIDWMPRWSEIKESIPPAYTEHIGQQLIQSTR
jgi:DNA (cytosine-5)-methyltransferase 1